MHRLAYTPIEPNIIKGIKHVLYFQSIFHNIAGETISIMAISKMLQAHKITRMNRNKHEKTGTLQDGTRIKSN